MKNVTWIIAVIYISYTFVLDVCDACNVNSYCTVEAWAAWGSCKATCGGGVNTVKERQMSICCDPHKYSSLKGCLQGCNITFSWWQANATEYKQCGKCQRGGTFDINQNSCVCPSGYGGSCCDIRTTLRTTMKTTTTTNTIPTAIKTTSKPSIKPITINVTTKKKGLATSCSGNPCHHGKCIPLNNQYFCLCTTGYEGHNCEKDIDDCANSPCQYGTCKDMVDDFHCECVVFFKGKMCSKFTSWAIAFISLASLALLLAFCCGYRCLFGTDDEKKKVEPLRKKSIQYHAERPPPLERPAPTERPPRYDDW